MGVSVNSIIIVNLGKKEKGIRSYLLCEFKTSHVFCVHFELLFFCMLFFLFILSSSKIAQFPVRLDRRNKHETKICHEASGTRFVLNGAPGCLTKFACVKR